MKFPTHVLSALGFTEPQPEKPIVFMRAGHTKGSRLQRVNPDEGNALLIRTYLKDPKEATAESRRAFRQAVVLRSVGGNLKHYPLWLLFSNTFTQEATADKHNQLPPDAYWVRRKRREVADYLKTRICPKTVESLEQINSKV